MTCRSLGRRSQAVLMRRHGLHHRWVDGLYWEGRQQCRSSSRYELTTWLSMLQVVAHGSASLGPHPNLPQVGAVLTSLGGWNVRG